MASPQAEVLKQTYRELRDGFAAADREPTLEELRASMNTMAHAQTEPAGVSIGETYAGGVRAFWHDPEGGAADRAILYLHGGGYVIGSPRTHEHLAGHLALAVGCRILNLDYRLAPEHPHPAAVEDATSAYRWLLDQGFAPERLAIAGDSAGGGLALATLISIRQRGLAQPAAAVPLSPWTDMLASGESMETRAAVDLSVSREGLEMMRDAFVGEGDARDPLASPVYADLSGLAPLYLQVGDEETLLDDSTRIAASANAAGVEVKLDVFPEMGHVFQRFAGNVPEADEALARIGTWLRPRLGLPSLDG